MEMIEERSLDRRVIARNALIYGPTALIVVSLLGMSVNALVGGNPGAVLPGFVLAVVSFAVLYELIAALRDLRAEPVVIEGVADRIWKKSRLLVFGRQDYLLVERKVFEIGAIAATELKVGQQVSIKHWPHTMRVITLERSRDADPPRRR